MKTAALTMEFYRKARKRLVLHAALVYQSFERVEASAKSLEELVDAPLSGSESANWLAEARSELEAWRLWKPRLSAALRQLAEALDDQAVRLEPAPAAPTRKLTMKQP